MHEIDADVQTESNAGSRKAVRVYTVIITILLCLLIGFCGLVIIAFKTGIYGNGDISTAIRIFVILGVVFFFGVWAFVGSKKRGIAFPLVVSILYTVLFVVGYSEIQSFF
ncbi:MAG: hypothetical protein JXA04_12465 [Gammaproteobacteria bacterium]|nr:hypothetical protein [Gammaproteobacteria bacterium]